ncbi:hypothetical protein AVEN_117978-1 [Araneus ventricosus]|uniref:Uncharacterized protein n=1 Tax=Araneus ventricosus TaxID=182803 RepID=A0A4Y2WPN5_ARAVE|nr:hypothetical protein AVEN_117978-1 [Araneus ventricosus]
MFVLFLRPSYELTRMWAIKRTLYPIQNNNTFSDLVRQPCSELPDPRIPAVYLECSRSRNWKSHPFRVWLTSSRRTGKGAPAGSIARAFLGTCLSTFGRKSTFKQT